MSIGYCNKSTEERLLTLSVSKDQEKFPRETELSPEKQVWARVRVGEGHSGQREQHEQRDLMGRNDIAGGERQAVC